MQLRLLSGLIFTTPGVRYNADSESSSKKKETDNARINNIQGHSRNHCCSRKPVSTVLQILSVSVAFVS